MGDTSITILTGAVAEGEHGWMSLGCGCEQLQLREPLRHALMELAQHCLALSVCPLLLSQSTLKFCLLPALNPSNGEYQPTLPHSPLPRRAEQ